MSEERTKLNQVTGSRFVWSKESFTLRDVLRGMHLSWIMERVRMSPLTKTLYLKDGEVVRHTTRPCGGLDVEIRHENDSNCNRRSSCH